MSISTAQRTPTEDAGGSRPARGWRRVPGAGPTDETALLHVGFQGGRTVVRRIRSEVPLGLRLLRRTGLFARVALVQTGASLVAGDDLRLRVIAERGARLELLEISATLAHPVRPGSGLAELSVRIELGDDARVVLAAQPLIVAAGSHVHRSLLATLEGSAQFVQRETVVLGRHREPAGALVARTRIVRAGRPILDEVLDTSTRSTYTSAAVLGGARVVDTLGGFGLVTDVPAGAFTLGPADTLVRRLGAAVGDELDGLQAVWRHAALLDPPREWPAKPEELG
jgi:urease accessory protein